MKKNNVLILSGFMAAFFCASRVAEAFPENHKRFSNEWSEKHFFLEEKLNVLIDSVNLKRIMYKLFNLPEIRKKNKFIDSLTNHKKGISMRVMKSPDRMIKHYWIAVGYDSDFRFETYYNFYVWPKQMFIKYLDPITGELLTLEEWRIRIKVV
jgi:hypothetical protein